MTPQLWYPFYSWENEAWGFMQSMGSMQLGRGGVVSHTQTLWTPESMLSWAVLFYPHQTPTGMLVPYDTDKCHFR